MSTGGGATQFGALLRWRRQAAGLSQEELAERAGLSRRGISDLERGIRRVPYAATLRRLADALGLPPAELMAALSGDNPELAQRRVPEPLTSFVGRQSEVQRLAELLARTRLVTLVGVGGVGKTRLALEVAKSWPDAAFVDLAVVDDAGLVAASVASALGLREAPNQPVLDLIMRAVGARQVLLLLDNCEHLAEACADVAARLLRVCSSLRILATSREPLLVAGEQRWPVAPLPVEVGSPGPGQGVADGVRLFVERACLAQPGFTLDEETRPAVTEICRQLDGLPLAIELAAVRVPAFGVQQLAARLDDRFHLLSGAVRLVPARHQTLRRLIDWSYDLLTSTEQALFRRVAVFVGGCSLDMAQKICAGDGLTREQVMESLPRLVEKSLVLVGSEPCESRYQLLETLRQYAAEQLRAAAEEDGVRRRHLEWCVALAEHAAAEFDGPRRAAWLRRLEREHGNLRSALAYSLAHAEHREAALRLAGALEFFWWLGGHVQEGSWWFSQVLQQLPMDDGQNPAALRVTEARARALAPAAHLRLRQGDLAGAQGLLEEARALAACISCHAVEANARVGLGQLALEAGDPTTARSHFEAGLRLTAEASAGMPPRYLLLVWLGHAAEAAGEPAEAGRLYCEARQLTQASQDVFFEAVAARGQGSVAIEQNDAATARRLLHEAVALSRRLENTTVAYGTLLAHFARLAGLEGDPERAVRLAGAALAARQAAGTDLHAYDRKLVDSRLESARHLLPRGAADAAWAQGQAMGLEAALAYAETPVGTRATRSPGAGRVRELGTSNGSALTTRERDVARLAAAGWTNRQIAAELVISSGTVKRHLENILGKLGLASRAQLAGP